MRIILDGRAGDHDGSAVNGLQIDTPASLLYSSGVADGRLQTVPIMAVKLA
jgi:hypothetical protein